MNIVSFPARKPQAPVQAIVCGASAGAIEALSGILPQLPVGFPLPIMVVVHLPADRKSVLTDLFRARCRLEVCEAEDKEPLCPGTIYFAPPDYHLLVEADRRLSLSTEEPVNYSRPAIDVLFESAADAFGSGLVGIVLSGANSDGALGLRAICQAGGTALVQSPDQAQASAMPLAALHACPAAQALSLADIATYLLQIAGPA